MGTGIYAGRPSPCRTPHWARNVRGEEPECQRAISGGTVDKKLAVLECAARTPTALERFPVTRECSFSAGDHSLWTQPPPGAPGGETPIADSRGPKPYRPFCFCFFFRSSCFCFSRFFSRASNKSSSACQSRGDQAPTPGEHRASPHSRFDRCKQASWLLLLAPPTQCTRTRTSDANARSPPPLPLRPPPSASGFAFAAARAPPAAATEASNVAASSVS